MLTRPLLVLSAASALALTAVSLPAFAAETGDPHAGRQFGIDQVRAQPAWAVTTGRGTVIAIVDSGVDIDHPDLDGKLLPGATFLGCGSSPCGNGDWESGPAERAGSKSPHGTHVAGIAAAETANGIGIAGVAPDAALLPVKALDDDGGSFADIAAGVRWSVDNGADVVNLSLGALPGAQALTFTGVISDLEQAVAYARSRGAVVLAAAGNDFVSPLCGSPAFDSGAVCVVATDKREQRAAYSNFALNEDVQAVAAPGGSAAGLCGEDVVSTVPLGTGGAAVCGYGVDYDEYAGTSMATPHAAGVAALLMAQGRTDDEVVDVLLTTSRLPNSNTRGVFTPSHGWGIVDAQAAVAVPLGATPSPSPTASASPSASPSGSPSPSPSATASPSPSPSASPSPSSSPSPWVSPSPSESPSPSPTSSPEPAEPAVAPAPERPDGVTRFAGADRFATAAATSRGSFPGGANDVFVVTGESWPDALSAGPAAARLSAPVLPVTGSGIPASIGVELDRLSPARAWVVGGRGVVGDGVVRDLQALGISVTRVSGDNRFATAAAVAARFFPEAEGAYYASGGSYADALGGGAAAAHREWPLLLTAKDTVPGDTPRVGAERIVLGGASVVSEAVRQELGARRVAGDDRYSTAAAIARDAFSSARVVYLATGLNFPDALAGAPAAARDDAPLLLAAKGCVTPATRDAAVALGGSSRVVLGGTGVVSDEAANLKTC